MMTGHRSRSNRLLTLFFGLAVLIQLGYLLVGLASLPAFYHRVTTQTVPVIDLYGDPYLSNAIVAAKAAERHLSLPGYAIYRIGFNSIVALIPAVVAFLILRRARWQWFAWFTAFVLLFQVNSALGEQASVAGLVPFKWYGLNDIFWFLILLYIFLFPNGRVVPRRLGYVILTLVVFHFFVQLGTVVAYLAPEFAARARLPHWSGIWSLPVLINFILVLIGQVYRYRRVSTTIERQQTKWFVIGFGMVIALSLLSLFSQGRGGFLEDIGSLSFSPLPIALAFAVLRYRLWDIDVIIRRTLMWGAITAILGLLYFGGVTLGQSILASVSGQRSPAVVVVSTLAIAALFTPLRRRVQDFVDRRFYRRRYDAEQALQTFAARARDEVELESLTIHLLAVVQESLQPARVSLWMKPSHTTQVVPGRSLDGL